MTTLRRLASASESTPRAVSRRRLSLAVPCVAALLCAIGVTPAHAQPASDQGSDTAPRVTATLADLERVSETLRSPNEDAVQGAIDQLIVINHPRVVPPLAELLRSGPSDLIANRALDALKSVADPGAIEVLTEFTSHRRVAARRRAFLALAAIDDRRVPDLLTRGLRDSDRTVRGSAAIALGEIGANQTLDLLFLAFDRNVIEAAIAIGKLGNLASIERFDGYLGNVPLGVMLSGYDEYLRREDIPLEAKTAIVEKLGEVAGIMVRQFLQNYLRWFPTTRIRNGELRTFKGLVEETIARIPETGGGMTIRTGASQ